MVDELVLYPVFGWLTYYVIQSFSWLYYDIQSLGWLLYAMTYRLLRLTEEVSRLLDCYGIQAMVR